MDAESIIYYKLKNNDKLVYLENDNNEENFRTESYIFLCINIIIYLLLYTIYKLIYDL